jgi:PPOX class probable F420-dependent enzyme
MELSAQKYVSLTTYRRNGEAVPVPVWIAPLGDGRIGFTTDGGSGKAKRMRNNATVEVMACDVRGNVADGASPTAATATLVNDGPELAEVRAAVAGKYGIQFRLMDGFGTLKRKLGRGSGDVVGVVLTLG